MGAFGTLMCTLSQNLAGLSIPMAVLAFVIALIAFLAAPYLPEWASGMKGSLVKIITVVIFIGFSPSLINGLASLSGKASVLGTCTW